MLEKRIPWNKGLTKETNEIVRRISESKLGDKNSSKRLEVRRKISEALKGHIPWNKGKKNIYSMELLNGWSEQLKGKTYEDLYGKEKAKLLKNMKKEEYKVNPIRNIKGNKHHSWKGGCRRYFGKKARNVIEDKIGRKLSSKEIVHHLDGDYRNYSIENLYLFPNQFMHIDYHAMLRCFVRQELELY